MASTSREIREAAEFVRAHTDEAPPVGVVLGSGLGSFAEALEDPSRWAYSELPHFPRSGVPGHAGRLLIGGADGERIVCLEGRVHLYEGYSPSDVVFGVRLLSALGCRVVLLTNAAGGIRSGLGPGEFMLVVDQLNLTGQNPLIGHPAPACFVDMSQAYDPEILALGRRAAAVEGVRLSEGVYAGLFGPSYETPAEVRMLGMLGADAVGMSTVLEVLALRALGVRVGALSSITNHAAGLGASRLDHADVERVARENREPFNRLLARWTALVREVAA